MTNSRSQPEFAMGWDFKTHTHPYYFISKVKPAPLGLGQVRYPQVGQFLSSLIVPRELIHARDVILQILLYKLYKLLYHQFQKK